ncbi:MAG: ornithine cyclodeaminase [Burkholderiales bacterium]|nr:MAG: ornithine cyclodeaminase [Betaproteobacteria bacterium]TAG24291.1 MAG: ornithine cyclodeaminase [Burkholderiales bacterium]
MTFRQPMFLSPVDVAMLVRQRGIRRVLREMTEAIEEDFRRWSEFDKSPRVANHSPDGVIELMPVSDAKCYAFKYVNGHPRNGLRNLPTVMAFGVLADVDTGMPLLLSEMTLTTALRTAATSAMAARALARKNSKTMAIIGNGAQSEFQALAFAEMLGVETFRLFDTDVAATQKLIANLKAMGLTAVACASISQAVKGADIITTVTADKTNATIITPDMIEPGMHINGVGGDCPGKTEIHSEVLRAAKVFVEYEPQTRIEGDLQQMPTEFAVTELWNVLSGSAVGRSDDEDITFFDSVGFAIEDYSALRYLYEQANQAGNHEELPLIPLLADPRNLFALLRPMDSARATQRAGVQCELVEP